MDRPVTDAVRRQVRARKLASSALVVIAVVGLAAWARDLVAPRVDRARVRVASVDTGAIEATISATGVVVPEIEEVIASPITTRVIRILRRPGDTVRRGDPILELDVAHSKLDVEKLDHQLALKRNQIEAARLDLEKTLTSLQSQVDIRALELASYVAKTTQQRQLASMGVVSDNAVRQAALDEQTARIGLAQLERTMETERKSARTAIEGLNLQLATLAGERAEAQRVLERATTHAGRDGVITWVVPDEGAAVQEGAIIARVADLSRLRVKATISDLHSDSLTEGLLARVKVNDQWITGRVAAINPTAENGTFAAEVALDNPSLPSLRSNLRVDVLLVTERRDQALRIPKGPFATGSGRQHVFVIRGDVAVRVAVRLGISDADHYEVAEGLAHGDQVIVSDASGFAHAHEVRLR